MIFDGKVSPIKKSGNKDNSGKSKLLLPKLDDKLSKIN
jgi:hypothetical protein